MLTDGDPRLLRVADPVVKDDPDLPLHIDLVAACLMEVRAWLGFGRAIAAPQLGIPRRLIVMDLGAGPVAFVNPEITWRSADMHLVWDDCFSIPRHLSHVERHRSISLRYHDRHFNECVWPRLPEDMAELLQHEIDHLDGILMTQRAAGPGAIAPISERQRLPAPQRTARRITLDGIIRSRGRIESVFLNAPQFDCETLSAALGCHVLLKVETVNPVRSFKGRGASFFVRELAAARPNLTLVAASAGNWGQALSYCCRAEGMPLIVYAAIGASQLKVERMRALGARVRLHGEDFDAAKAEARRFVTSAAADRNGEHLFVEDGLETRITEGHGTIAMEMIEDASRPGTHLDAVVVPLGNGALLNGVARWMKATSPATRSIGVCAHGAPSMRDSWLRGRHSTPILYQSVETIADGIAIRTPISEAVEDMFEVVDDVVQVSDEHIRGAMRLVLRHAGLVLEPSGAVGIAAILAHPAAFRALRIGCILSGGNMTVEEALRVARAQEL